MSKLTRAARARLRLRAERRRAKRKASRARERVHREACLASLSARQAGTRVERAERACRRLFRVERRERERKARVRALAAVLVRRAPRLVSPDHAITLDRILHGEWTRDPGEWRPRGHGAVRLLHSLARHLLVRYTMPAFLLDEFLFGHAHHRDLCDAATLFRRLARGEGLREASRDGVIAPLLTRRMRHRFLATPRGWSANAALRRAQVMESGGSELLARAVAEAGLEDHQDADESFWVTVIRWFCRQGDLDPDRVLQLTDLIHDRCRYDPEYDLAGRTPKALMSDLERWRRAMKKAGRDLDRAFPASGLAEGRWTDPASGAVWTLTEIRTPHELAEEGRVLHHCVGAYVDRAAVGVSSFWSLRCGRGRRGTVEVHPLARNLVRFGGSCNRDPDPEERDIVHDWAVRNELRPPAFSESWL